MRDLYVVGTLVTKKKVKINNVQGEHIVDLPLTWTDKMVGVLPVFSNKKYAKKIAGKDYPIFAVTQTVIKKAEKS